MRTLPYALLALLLLLMAAPLRAASVPELESLGRAHPAEAGAQALQQAQHFDDHAPERLELLTVHGLVHATAFDARGAEPSVRALETWGREPGAPRAAEAQAAALLVRAVAAMRAGSDMKRADALLQQAFALLPAQLPARTRYRYVATRAYVKDQSGELESAVRLGLEALALADQEGLGWRASEARTELAFNHYHAKQGKRAHALADEALALARGAGDAVAMGRASNVQAILAQSDGDIAGERRWLEAAIDSARRAGSKIDEARYLANLADVYLHAGDFKTALAYGERALPLAREIGNPDTTLVALSNIGLAHIALRNVAVGKRYMQQAVAIDERRGATVSIAEGQDELAGYLERAGDLAGAVQAYHRYRALATEMLRADQQKAVMTLQAQYDAAQRAKTIELLNREQQVKAEQLRRRDLQQMLGVLVAATMVLALAAVVLLLRRVRATNAALADSNAALALQSERDPLTGLPNRRRFQAAMQRMAAGGTLAGSVYLIDIDHFKHINDRHGHAAGDAVLVEAARRLRAALRDDDLIVRWGGEEFVVVVGAPVAAAPEAVDALGARLLDALAAAPVEVAGQRIPVTASIGYATFPLGALQLPWERALDVVDTAMYLAKAHGRNRAYGVRPAPGMDPQALAQITGNLERAHVEGRVVLTLLEGRAPRQLQLLGAAA